MFDWPAFVENDTAQYNSDRRLADSHRLNRPSRTVNLSAEANLQTLLRLRFPTHDLGGVDLSQLNDSSELSTYDQNQTGESTDGISSSAKSGLMRVLEEDTKVSGEISSNELVVRRRRGGQWMSGPKKELRVRTDLAMLNFSRIDPEQLKKIGTEVVPVSPLDRRLAFFTRSAHPLDTESSNTAQPPNSASSGRLSTEQLLSNWCKEDNSDCFLKSEELVSGANRPARKRKRGRPLKVKSSDRQVSAQVAHQNQQNALEQEKQMLRDPCMFVDESGCVDTGTVTSIPGGKGRKTRKRKEEKVGSPRRTRTTKIQKRLDATMQLSNGSTPPLEVFEFDLCDIDDASAAQCVAALSLSRDRSESTQHHQTIPVISVEDSPSPGVRHSPSPELGMGLTLFERIERMMPIIVPDAVAAVANINDSALPSKPLDEVYNYCNTFSPISDGDDDDDLHHSSNVPLLERSPLSSPSQTVAQFAQNGGASNNSPVPNGSLIRTDEEFRSAVIGDITTDTLVSLENPGQVSPGNMQMPSYVEPRLQPSILANGLMSLDMSLPRPPMHAFPSNGQAGLLSMTNRILQPGASSVPPAHLVPADAVATPGNLLPSAMTSCNMFVPDRAVLQHPALPFRPSMNAPSTHPSHYYNTLQGFRMLPPQPHHMSMMQPRFSPPVRPNNPLSVQVSPAADIVERALLVAGVETTHESNLPCVGTLLSRPVLPPRFPRANSNMYSPEETGMPPHRFGYERSTRPSSTLGQSSSERLLLNAQGGLEQLSTPNTSPESWKRYLYTTTTAPTVQPGLYVSPPTSSTLRTSQSLTQLTRPTTEQSERSTIGDEQPKLTSIATPVTPPVRQVTLRDTTTAACLPEAAASAKHDSSMETICDVDLRTLPVEQNICPAQSPILSSQDHTSVTTSEPASNHTTVPSRVAASPLPQEGDSDSNSGKKCPELHVQTTVDDQTSVLRGADADNTSETAEVQLCNGLLEQDQIDADSSHTVMQTKAPEVINDIGIVDGDSDLLPENVDVMHSASPALESQQPPQEPRIATKRVVTLLPKCLENKMRDPIHTSIDDDQARSMSNMAMSDEEHTRSMQEGEATHVTAETTLAAEGYRPCHASLADYPSRPVVTLASKHLNDQREHREDAEPMDGASVEIGALVLVSPTVVTANATETNDLAAAPTKKPCGLSDTTLDQIAHDASVDTILDACAHIVSAPMFKERMDGTNCLSNNVDDCVNSGFAATMPIAAPTAAHTNNGEEPPVCPDTTLECLPEMQRPADSIFTNTSQQVDGCSQTDVQRSSQSPASETACDAAHTEDLTPSKLVSQQLNGRHRNVTVDDDTLVDDDVQFNPNVNGLPDTGDDNMITTVLTMLMQQAVNDAGNSARNGSAVKRVLDTLRVHQRNLNQLILELEEHITCREETAEPNPVPPQTRYTMDANGVRRSNPQSSRSMQSVLTRRPESTMQSGSPVPKQSSASSAKLPKRPRNTDTSTFPSGTQHMLMLPTIQDNSARNFNSTTHYLTNGGRFGVPPSAVRHPFVVDQRTWQRSRNSLLDQQNRGFNGRFASPERRSRTDVIEVVVPNGSVPNERTGIAGR